MRNQLTGRKPILPGAAYSAAGQLDGNAVDLLALSHGTIVIGFGLANVTLSREAVVELIDHLAHALEVIECEHDAVSAGGQ